MSDWRKARDEICAYALKLSRGATKFDTVGKCFKGDFIQFQMAAKVEVVRVNMVEEHVVESGKTDEMVRSRAS